MTTESRTLNVGIVGLGQAGGGVAPAAAGMSITNLIGAADTNQRSLDAFKEKYGKKTYGSIEELLKDPEIDTVRIATPNVYHAPHTIMAADHGKNVIIEKPMAINLDEAQQMIDACDRNGVHLLCGGSRSYSAVVRKMREVVKSGELGKLRAMTSWAATDWMLRPRRPDEYDLKYGGGIAFRQSAHAVDSVRLIGGGLVRNVRGVTGAWLPPRNTAPGFYSAILEFEDDAFTTLVYDAYGYFMASELFEPDTGGPSAPSLESRLESRREITGGTRDELAAKSSASARARTHAPLPALRQAASVAESGYLSDLGLLHVACEHGEMRQSPEGIYKYTDSGTVEEPLTELRGQQNAEFEELYEAIVHERPLLHGGRWGLATLEVSLAIMESANKHQDIKLQHQVPTPDWA